jgi:hypothetical protein
MDLVRYDSAGNFADAMDVEEPRKVNELATKEVEEARKRDIQKLAKKCLEGYKKCTDLLEGNQIEQEERLEVLKEKHRSNTFFMKLCSQKGL